MSYDIYLKDSATGLPIMFGAPHFLHGGTYAIGGTCEAWYNVTYNYAPHFYRLLGEKGIRSIYGMTASESIPVLEKAAIQLASEVSDNYWDATEGNAKKALMDLIQLAKLSPNGIWDGD